MDAGDTYFEKSSPERLVRRPIHTLQLSNGATNGHNGGSAEVYSDAVCTIELRRYEFGGSFGVTLLFLLLPICLFCVNLALVQYCRKPDVLTDKFPSILWRSLQDWQAHLVVIGWLLAHGAFYRFTCTDVSRNAVWGRQLADGSRLMYNCNGVSCLVTSLCLVGVCALCGFAVHVDAWLVHHRLGLVASSAVTSFVLALWFYWSSFRGVHALGLTLDCNGSPLYDMFIGRQLNPRVCTVVDVKLVLFRQALVAWAVQIALSVVAVHASRIDVNWPMIVLAATQLLYIFDALWYEEQLLNTFAMLHDGVGWMQLFGSLCVVPFLFSVPMCYLGELKVPVTPSMMCSLAHLAIFDKKLVHTYKASFPLYADGWWGWVRHPNYTGEVIMAVAWTSLCGFGHFLPYTYLLYLVLHLALRTGRQERMLRLHYATPWLDYCDLVPYRVVPKVWVWDRPLVMAAEAETAYQEGAARGLCAVLLFYSHKWYVARTLCLMAGSARGRYSLQDDGGVFGEFCAEYLDRLFCGSEYVQTLLDTITSTDASVEIEKLQQPHVKGVGDARHQHLVCKYVTESAESLADALLLRACNAGLSSSQFATLLKPFRTGQLPFGVRHAELSLVFAALYAIDTSLLDFVQSQEDLSVAVPWVSDTTQVHAFSEQVVTPAGVSYTQAGAHAALMLAWAVAIRALTHNHWAAPALDGFPLDEEDVAERAARAGVFAWLRALPGVPRFAERPLWARRIHGMLTQFVIYFPMLRKELAAEAEEELRRARDLAEHGAGAIRVPQLHFEHLLLAVSELYQNSDEELAENLVLDYWCGAGADGGLFGGHSMLSAGGDVTSEKVVLYKFVRWSGDSGAAEVHVAALRMVTALCRGTPAADACLTMLISPDTPAADTTGRLNLLHFMHALQQYAAALQSATVPRIDGQQRASLSMGRMPAIAPQELDALLAWLELLRQLLQQSDMARRLITSGIADGSNSIIKSAPSLSSLTGSAGVRTLLQICIAVSAPAPLRAACLRCVAAAATDERGRAVVTALLPMSVVHLPAGHSCTLIQAVQRELEEVESTSESYVITLAGLELVDAVLTGQWQHFDAAVDTDGRDPAAAATQNRQLVTDCIMFAVDAVAAHFVHRAYQSEEDKWLVGTRSMKVLRRVVTTVECSAQALASLPLGGHVLASLTNDTPLLKSVLKIIMDGLSYLESYSDDSSSSSQLHCTMHALAVLDAVLAKQDALRDVARDCPAAGVMVGDAHALLFAGASAAELIRSFAGIIRHADRAAHCCLHAVRILRTLGSRSAAEQTRLVRTLLPVAAQLRCAAARLLLPDGSSLSRHEAEQQAALDPDGVIDVDTRPSESQLRVATGRACIALLSDSVRLCDGLYAPGLAHLLCGYDLRLPATTSIENAGATSDAGLHCVHSLTQLLCELAVEPPILSADYWHMRAPLALPGARLALALCTDVLAGRPLLAYWRNAHNLIERLVRALVLPSAQDNSNGADTSVTLEVDHAHDGDAARAELCGLVLNMAAAELRQLLADGRSSTLLSLLGAILAPTSKAGSEAAMDNTLNGFENRNNTTIAAYSSTIQRRGEQSFSVGATTSAAVGSSTARGSLLMRALRSVQLQDMDALARPPLVYLDAKRLAQVLDACCTTSDGAAQTNVHTLNVLLRREAEHVPSKHAKPVLDEVNLVLRLVVSRNAAARRRAGHLALLDGWRRCALAAFALPPAALVVACGDAEHAVALVSAIVTSLLGQSSISVGGEEAAECVSTVCCSAAACLRRMIAHTACENGVAAGALVTQWSAPLERATAAVVAYMLRPASQRRPTSTLLCAALHSLVRVAVESDQPVSSWSSRQVDGAAWSALSRHNVALTRLLFKYVLEGDHALCVSSCALLSSVLAEDALRSGDWARQLVTDDAVRYLIEATAVAEQDNLAQCISEASDSALPLHTFACRLMVMCRLTRTRSGADALLLHEWHKVSQMALWRHVPDQLFALLSADSATGIKAVLVGEKRRRGDVSTYRYLAALRTALRLCAAVCASSHASLPLLLQVRSALTCWREPLMQLLRLFDAKEFSLGRSQVGDSDGQLHDQVLLLAGCVAQHFVARCEGRVAAKDAREASEAVELMRALSTWAQKHAPPKTKLGDSAADDSDNIDFLQPSLVASDVFDDSIVLRV